MKLDEVKPCRRLCIALCVITILGAVGQLQASSIHKFGHRSWIANAGWLDLIANGENGVSVEEFVFSGYAYASNIGWVFWGDGSPENGIQYSNSLENDYGVNLLSDGRIRGYAYGANIGWLVFEDMGDARLHYDTGHITGYAYSPNIGWIQIGSDTNPYLFLLVNDIKKGRDEDEDGISDAWELKTAGNLEVLELENDFDGDLILDTEEYIADTNPMDPGDYFRVDQFTPIPTTSMAAIEWAGKKSRIYNVEKSSDLKHWSPYVKDLIGNDASSELVPFSKRAPVFYRILVKRPLDFSED